MEAKQFIENPKEAIDFIKETLREKTSCEDGSYYLHISIIDGVIVFFDNCCDAEKTITVNSKLNTEEIYERVAEILNVEYSENGNWDDNEEIFENLLEVFENNVSFEEDFTSVCEEFYGEIVEHIKEEKEVIKMNKIYLQEDNGGRGIVINADNKWYYSSCAPTGYCGDVDILEDDINVVVENLKNQALQNESEDYISWMDEIESWENFTVEEILALLSARWGEGRIMEKRKTTTSATVKKRYNDKAYDRIEINTIPKGKKRSNQGYG